MLSLVIYAGHEGNDIAGKKTPQPALADYAIFSAMSLPFHNPHESSKTAFYCLNETICERYAV